MTELSEYSLEIVWNDGSFVLSKAVRSSNGSSLLILSPTEERSTLVSVMQLEHAYALRSELDRDWAVLPFELAHYEGQRALLMEDPGGELLAPQLGRPWELTRFLRIAIGIASSLMRLHEQGFVHKDIKPANILVNRETGKVWLMGFGVTSRLSRERNAPGPSPAIVGTLPYMAPEQTGCMNRSIDSRSDLYAFGITLYEILTGVLPFVASTPMEWIHCHIARDPMPVSERVEDIPAVVSSIISKLMSKNAEDRYQTAAGAEADLRRCLREWESRGHIKAFSLGTFDVSDRLLIPEKLYGRSREIRVLVEAFQRVSVSGTMELVLVSGYSGTGKSSLVNELQRSIVPSRGLFALGKFDQYKEDIPYASLAQAFRNLIAMILSQNDTELIRWRVALQEAVGISGQLIVNLIPEVGLVIGKQPSLSEVSPNDLQKRFQKVFRRFLGVFARPEHPLVLFLDDLQWLDTATLELLEYLLVESPVRHTLLVGAYRSNEIVPSHPLVRAQTEIHHAEVIVNEILLKPLKLDDVARLVSDTLHSEPNMASPLSALVYEKTGGNPFFVSQFLSSLVEERLITFDYEAMNWIWDLERLRAKGYTDNLAEFMLDKLNYLPVVTRELVKKLACLGNSAETAILSMIQETSEDEIHSVLWDAVKAGIIYRSGEAYSFLHDRIQEAAYALIPIDERAETHLRIGRLLAGRISQDGRENRIFEIVNQFNRGLPLIKSIEDREQVAELNLMAGSRAKTAAAYMSASTYLATGRELLGANCWERRYSLVFALEFNGAECEFLTGRLAAAEQRLSVLSNRAITSGDKSAVACLFVALYTTLDRYDRAIDVGLEYLRQTGMELLPNPTDQEVQTEYDRMWQLLGNREIDELLDLPLMSESTWRVLMDVLVAITPPALFTDENLQHLLILRMANLSLEHGNCDGSCYAYVCLNIVLAHRFGNYQAGLRFGLLGVDLVERRALDRFKARVYMCFGTLVLPWTKQASSGEEWIRRSFETANGMGDLTFAAYSKKNLITNLFVSGAILSEVQREAESGLAFARSAQFGLVVDCVIGQLALIRFLRGLTSDFVPIVDDGSDEGQLEKHLKEKSHLSFAASCYWIYKLQASVFAGDYRTAVNSAMKAQELLWATKSFLETAEYHFYGALARAGACDTVSDDQRREHIDALYDHYKQIVVWKDHCEEHFASWAILVAAEMARVEGRALDAEHLYDEAVGLARKNGVIQTEAIANESAARFYAARGLEAISRLYLHNAKDCYLRWGADGKVQQLERLYPNLWKDPAVFAHGSVIDASLAHLDISTVVKVSQAVSSEIVLEKLIQTLIAIAVERAGAQRGLLILPQGKELRIEVEATTIGESITVRAVEQPPTPWDLPESILNYVVRTQESLILDDAQLPNIFSFDHYIAQKRARSILCLPLVRRATVVGALYLENAEAAYVFTSDRVEVLKLLASQAAISMENARLYANLHESEGSLRLAIDTIPAIVWSNSADGSVDFINKRWQEYTGLPVDERLGKGWTTPIHPEDAEAMIAAWRVSFKTGTPFAHEARIRRADGEYRHFLNRALPLRDVAGQIVKWYGSAIDIEDLKHAEKDLQIAYEEIQELKDTLYRENVILKEEIERSSMFKEIVGTSSGLNSVLSRVSKVAPTDSTVLITGETGTGKELIARAIHDASPRSRRSFVSVNCAAIPQSLIASELFGHEKGAFTGAQQRRLGRFELADGGTIFLDEVGELSMETQVALLRVLQEREFERIGGNRLISVDVRVITATNRDLEEAVKDGMFRSDLFYRLSVFPIELPPLRERKEDIPMLVEYFIDRFARKTGKRVWRIKKKTLDQLQAYSWPGNIRELQNVIERSLIISETEDLTVDEKWLHARHEPSQDVHNQVNGTLPATLQEKEIIEAALAEAKGRVSGPLGAATRLKMPASTLDYKIRILGINKHRFKA